VQRRATGAFPGLWVCATLGGREWGCCALEKLMQGAAIASLNMEPFSDILEKKARHARREHTKEKSGI